MPRMTKGAKCTCNPTYMILSAIIIAVGAFMAIQGFVTQLTLGGAWDMGAISWILVLYIVGIIIVGVGKIVKWKAHGMCPAHGMVK